MKTTMEILKAKPIAVKNLRKDLFNIVKGKEPYLVTTDGERQMFLLPYEDVIEILETLEESRDVVLREEITRARNEYNQGGGGRYERHTEK
jgi:hypothetical protein